MTLKEYFHSWLVHYHVGFAYGLTLRFLPKHIAKDKVEELYYWGWNREVKQHDPDLNPHQIQEARAWGDGASKALGLEPDPPIPPYPAGA